MTSLFDRLPAIDADPIFRVSAEAKAAGPSAIDGTIGVFMDEHGKPARLPSVRDAITELSADLPEGQRGYPPLLGVPEYRTAVLRLLFGETIPAGAASIGTIGGTGALAVNVRLLQRMAPEAKLVLPTPAWGNYRPLFADPRIEVLEVPHITDGQASIDGILTALETERSPLAIVLQTSCHNPTGLDLSPERWHGLAAAMAARGATAILDMAYQGFAGTPEEELLGLNAMRDAGVPVLLAWSASKNHSLYAQRVGLAVALTPDEKAKELAERHYGRIARSIHSASAAFGQLVVARTQEKHRDAWLTDLEDARAILRRKRDALVKGVPAFAQALSGNGMFALLPITKEQVLRLRSEKKVFLSDDGRLNVAGIPEKRLEELAAALRDCR